MKRFLYSTLCLALCASTSGCVTDSGVFGVARTITPGDEIVAVDTGSSLAQLLGLAATDKVIAIGLGNNCTLHDASFQGAASQTPFGRVEPGEYGRFIALFQVSNASGPFEQARLIAILDPTGNVVDESIAEYKN